MIILNANPQLMQIIIFGALAFIIFFYAFRSRKEKRKVLENSKEKTTNSFKINLYNLQIELSDDKIFINTFSSNETFALRSVNGLGVIDLLEDFNKRLIRYKILRLCVTMGISFLILSNGDEPFKIFAGFDKNLQQFIWIIILITIPTMIYKGYALIFQKPILMSAVRIMLNGGNRDFEFDKTGVDSEAVAEFVARVESTLTAYHKKD
jgi:hypothetical protein